MDPAAGLDLTFPVGSLNGQRECLNIPIIDDDDFELTQTFNVDVMTISPPIIPSAGPMAQVEISDNDGKPLLHPSHVLHTHIIISLPAAPTASLTSSAVSGSEGTTINGVCVQAPLAPGGEFESLCTVDLMAIPGTAGELLLTTCNSYESMREMCIILAVAV